MSELRAARARRPRTGLVVWAVLGGVVALAPAAGAQPADALIGTITVECDLPRCERASERARLERLTGLVAAKRYTEEDGRRALQFLEEVELFAPGSVELTTLPGPGNTVDIVFHTLGRTYIRQVEIDVGLSLEDEIEQRLFMRSGRTYNPADAQRQIDSITAIFEQDGYYGTSVQIIAEEVEPYLVDLVVRVDKGQRLDVRDIYLRGHQHFSYDELRAVLLSELGFFRTYNASALEDAVAALLQRYRDADHLRARIARAHAEPYLERGVVDLYIDIDEGPRWAFELIGNRVFSEEEILDVLPFFEIGYIDDAEVQRSVGEIEALYRTAGYYFVSVRASQQAIGEDRFRVVYTIYEGPLAEVRAIDFEGNVTATDAELLALMQTRVYSPLDSGGFLQPEQLEADVRTLEAYYRELGHLSAYVPRWTVVAADEGRTLYVTIFMAEGVRTRVSEVSFRGNSLMDASRLERGLLQRADRWFGPAALASDVATLQTRYLERGFRLQKFDTVCLVGDEWRRCQPPSVPAACMGYSPDLCVERRRGDTVVQECGRSAQTAGCEPTGGIDTEAVMIDHRFAEGSLVTMGEVFVIGNYDTDDDVIRAAIKLRRGDAFNPALLYESQAELRSLGLFTSVRVRTVGAGERAIYASNRAHVVVLVEEAASQFIEVRLGLASQNRVDDEFRVVADTELGFIDRNFLGRALEIQLLGSFEADLVGATRIADGEFIASAAGVLTDPRFDWFNTADDPWELRALLGYRYDLLSATLHEILIEGEAQVRQEFESVRGLLFSLALNVTRAETKLPEASAFDEPRLILRVEPALTLDRRDNPLNPRRGYRAEFVIELADRFFGRGVDTAEFTRIRLSGSYLVPIARHFVLGFYGRFGFALGGIFSGFLRPDAPEDGLVLPPSERFRLGGVSGVRAFPDNGLGPTGESGQPIFGDVVLNSTVEVRFPLVPAIDLYGAWFLDVGQLVPGFDDLTAEGFRFSTGLGIRLLAFGLVPVVLDYGLVLDRRPGESIGQLQFNVGYTF